MPLVAAGIGLAGTAISMSAGGDAADAAAGAQQDAMAQQMLMMQKLNELLKPYRKAGKQGLAGMLDLIGLGEEDAQAAAIANLEKSPYFTSLVKQGENAMLQNASATGGLRGGNLQAAMAEFRPQMLAQTIENQYSKLADLALRGQNAAAGTGAGQAGYASNIASMMQNIGGIRADQAMAQGQGISDLFSGLSSLYGQYQGAQGAKA